MAPGLRILGIDPGSLATGWGVVEQSGGRLSHVAHGTVRLSGAAPLARRLADLASALREVALGHAPGVAVVERIFVAASPRAALVLGQARGVALATVGALGIEVREYAPGEIKLSVAGTGAAEKRQVQAMVRRLLALDADPAADAADALAAAICHGHRGPLAALGATRRRGPGLRRAAGRASSVVVRRS